VTVSGVNGPITGPVPTSIGQCFARSDAVIAGCSASGLNPTSTNVGTSSSGAVCPAVEPPKSPAVLPPIDPSTVQTGVAAASQAAQFAWTIIITLVERQTNNGDHRELVNVFLTLVGSATPTSADYQSICDIVNTAVAPQVNQLKATLQCQLGTVTAAKKRDTNMVAIVSYPGSSNTGAGKTIAGALALIAASFALM